ncbi:SWIM zinc finger domain-containing protein [Streptococcus sp. 2021WUSS124]
MKNWMDYFKPHIVDRGYNLFLDDAVQGLEEVGEGYYALVSGSQVYQVEIDLEHGQLVSMWCECPHAQEMNHCKHMAAVLFAISELEGQPAVEGKGQSLAQLLDKLTVEQLRAFVLELAQEDRELVNRIQLRFSTQLTSQQVENVKKEIRDLGLPFEDRRMGYIEYRQTRDYERAVEKAMHQYLQPLLDRCEYESFLAVSDAFYHQICQQELDDSNGTTGSLLYSLAGYWQHLLTVAPDKIVQELLDWCLGQLSGYEVAEDLLMEFVEMEFQEETFLEQKLTYFQAVLQTIEEGDKSSWSWKFRRDRFAMLCYRLLVQLGSSEADLLTFQANHWEVAGLRKLAITQAVASQQLDRAVRLLQESKRLDAQYRGLVSDYSQQLRDIYRSQGQDDKVREELLEMIFSAGDTDLDLIEELRDYVSREEWQSYLDDLLEDRRFQSQQLKLLQLADRPQELLDRITASYWFLENLDRFEDYLSEKLPEQLRDSYAQAVSQQMEVASSRSHYRQLAGYLVKIAGLPDGKVVSTSLRTSWKVQYPRRKAMIEELDAVRW